MSNLQLNKTLKPPKSLSPMPNLSFYQAVEDCGILRTHSFIKKKKIIQEKISYKES